MVELVRIAGRRADELGLPEGREVAVAGQRGLVARGMTVGREGAGCLGRLAAASEASRIQARIA